MFREYFGGWLRNGAVQPGWSSERFGGLSTKVGKSLWLIREKGRSEISIFQTENPHQISIFYDWDMPMKTERIFYIFSKSKGGWTPI